MLQQNRVTEGSIDIDVAGDHELTWWDSGRPDNFAGAGGNQTYEVYFDGGLLGSFSTTTGSSWTLRSVVFSASVGTFPLEIAGTITTDDSALLDAFSIQHVPEPAALAAGSAALALLASRRGVGRRTRH
jgi:hypothetical protein